MIVTEAQVLRAMAFHEQAHIDANGPLDGVSLPGNCSLLADLLGVMWFHREDQANIPDDSSLAALIIDGSASQETN